MSTYLSRVAIRYLNVEEATHYTKIIIKEPQKALVVKSFVSRKSASRNNNNLPSTLVISNNINYSVVC
jgi:hypothetical protein